MRNSRRSVSINLEPVRTFSRLKIYLAVLAASQCMLGGQALAAPEGGEIVGGEGIIQQTGVETIITQATERMAIDWRSFDVAANERVEFIQPGASSIALNRVLGNRGSEILGRIDANGQVMLVNANGIVFGKDSIINVGGMIASGLNIDPNSFINGDFTLSSIEGAEGKIINYGIINAATGGSVTLVGEQVQNDGLISAKLGAVNLVAGNAAVLTFDPSGMLGIRVTEAVVQDELGVDAAVINNGTINAQGGRVLLSASVSEDVFSNAVNNAGMNKTSSVVVHEDGSFTLGAGADVINTGDISVSTTEGNAGQIVALGENITHSGSISANTSKGNGGSIELHSTDTTLLTENSTVSAQATQQGEGGDVKVLGNKVGLFDHAEVNASGANGGGQVLIGGDKTGQNQEVRNADFIYLSENSAVKTDALINGDGGKLITFATDTARIYGNLYSRGGSEGGNGGFIETSGLKGFEILDTPDIAAVRGIGGTWLIDPYDITINTQNGQFVNQDAPTFVSASGKTTLNVNLLSSALDDGVVVIVRTGNGGGAGSGNITLDTSLNYSFGGMGAISTLQLEAYNDIFIKEDIKRASNSTDLLNIILKANYDASDILDNDGDGIGIGSGTGSISIDKGRTINTGGGTFSASGVNFSTGINSGDATIPSISTGGGQVSLNMIGGINIGSDILTNNGSFNATGTSFSAHNPGRTVISTGTSNLTINANTTISLGSITTNNLAINADGNLTLAGLQVGNVAVSQVSGTALTVNGNATFNTYRDNTNVGGTVELLNSGNVFNGDLIFISAGTVKLRDSTAISLGASNINGDLELVSGGNITQSGSGVSVKDTTTITANNFDVVLNNSANKFNSVNFTGVIKSLDLLDSESDLSVGNVNTRINNQNSGNIKITNTAPSGSLTVGNLTTTGGVANEGQVGKNGGSVTLTANGHISVGTINTSGSAGNDNSNNNSPDYDGGRGGDVLITSMSSSVALGEIITDGGNGDADDNGNDDDANGGNAGGIAVRGTEIELTKSLFARGGRLEDYGTPDKNNGTGGLILLDGNVKINNSTDPIKIDTTLVETVINGSATRPARPGNVRINGNISAETSYVDALTINAAEFIISGKIGDASNSLGNLSITSTNSIGTAGLDIYAKSLVVTSAGFTAGDVFTFRDNENAGNVTITSTGIVNLNSIDAHGDSTTTDNGGIVSITGTSVTIGSVNTSGDTGGAISITANNAGTPKSITINGDLNSQSTSGQGLIELTLNNSSSVGSVNFNSTYFLSSNVMLVSSGASDTVKGPNTINNWTFSATDTGKITGENGKEISFTNFRNLTGGTNADTFNLSQNISGIVNGGNGADIFNINIASLDAIVNGGNDADTFNINVAATKLVLNGEAGADIFNINNTGNITATLTGGGGTDIINSANRTNSWILGTTESLNGTLIFSGIENIRGNAQKDSFSFVGTRAVSGIIDADAVAGVGVTNSLEDEVTVSGDGNIDFAAGNFSFFGVRNAEVLHSTGGGRLTVVSNASDTINWNFSDEQSVTKGTNTVKISGFTSYEGGAGNDIFLVENNTTFNGLIDGKAGQNLFDFHSATQGYSIVIGNEYQPASSATLLNIHNIIANSHADTSLKMFAGTNAWEIAGINTGKVGNTEFSGISKVIGASSSDSISTSINGDATWSIIGTNTGALSSTPSSTDSGDLLISFSNIGNLKGSDYNDTFSFSNDGRIVSAEGNGGTDTADLSAIDPRTITIGTALEFAFSGVEILKADILKDFTLTTSSGANWRIDNSDGIIDGTVAGIQFIGFKNLQGSSQADTFDIHTDFAGTIKSMDGDDTFNIRTAVTGVLEGGNGADRFVFFDGGSIDVVNGARADAGNDSSKDVVDLSNLTTGIPITIAGSTIHNVTNIERIIADSSKEFTLATNAATNTWRIEKNGVVDGTVAGIEFAGFKNLRGGAGADIFELYSDFTGSISGMGGDDIFRIRTNFTGSLLGGNGADSFVFFDGGSVVNADAGSDLSKDVVDLSNLTSGIAITIVGTTIRNVTNIERVIADSSKEFTLAASADTNTWRIENNGVIDGNVDGIEFAGFKNLRGGAGVDTFDLFTNFTGIINGMDGDDVFNIRANITGSLLGGNGADSFVFYSGSVTNANGGNDSSKDVVDLRNLAAGIPITLAGTSIHNVANIERVIADSSKEFTLVASAGTNTWRIENNGVIDGTVAGMEFSGFKNLHGGTGTDIFELYSNFTGSINGRGGEDIFRIRTNFTGSLQGGDGADRFVFFDGGIIDSANGGSADAGNDNSKDIADFGNLSDGITVYVDGTLIHNIANVEQVIGSATKNFTLAAISDTNDWLISGSHNGDNFGNGENDGVVNGVQFLNFKRLVGGAGNDTFTIGLGASIEAIDGGSGDNALIGRDSLNTWRITSANSGSLAVTNGSVYVPVFERIQNLTGGILADEFIIDAAIGNLIGNNGNDRFVFSSENNNGSAKSINGSDGNDEIVGRNSNNTWSITGDNAGSVSVTDGIAYVTSFSGVDKLIGGAGADIFNINFSIKNGIEAGDGDNIFNVNTAVGDLIGGAGDDQFKFFEQGSARSVVGGGGTNSIYGRNAENIWTITAPNAGNIRTVSSNYLESFSNIQILNGGNLADTFNINAIAGNIFGHGGDDIFSFAGNNNGIVNLIDGGNGNNTLRGRNQNSIWTMTGANSGRVSTSTPNIYVNEFRQIKTIVGNGDVDQLVALNQENSWTINGNNRGFLSATLTPAITVAFEGIENLLGNEDVDLFTFTANGHITGLIDGGSTISKDVFEDTLDLSQKNGNVRVQLGGQSTNALNVVNVEKIIAPEDANNELRGASDTNYRWRITGDNQGKIETVDDPLSETSISFINFNDLRGGTRDDYFNVDKGKINRIDGGGGNGIDYVDYSERKEDFDIVLGGSDGFAGTYIYGIEGIKGNSEFGFSSTIKVDTVNNDWQIGSVAGSAADGKNDGNVTINNNKITFENFTNIIGGSGRDTFTYLENGQWIGTISGGGGHNIIDASLSTMDQQFVLDGIATDAGTKFRGIAQLIGNASTNSKLISTLQANTWEISAQGNGRLNNLEFRNIANLQGGAFADTFNISDLSWLTGVIDGGGGDGIDIVNLHTINTAIIVAVDSQTLADINIVNVESINANPDLSNTLKGDLNGNEWNINARNAGILNKTINFTGFANLTGSDVADLVIFNNNAANLTGHVDLGAGQDVLDLRASDRNVTVQLNSSKTPVANGVISVQNIEEIRGAANRSNQLTADNYDNNWIIDDTDSGRVSSGEAGTTTFTNFKSLTGGSKDDLFVFEALGNATGLVDGGMHSTRDTVDLSKSNNANVTVASSGDISGFANIEKFTGNNVTSKFTAANIENTWSLSGTNRGTLNGTIEFENFGVLSGGNRRDEFVINSANISGSIDSGDGDDIFKIQDSTIGGSIDSGDGNDTFNIQTSVIAGKIKAGNGNDEFNFTIVPGAEGAATIEGGEGDNRLTIRGGDANYKAIHQIGRQEYVDTNNNTYSILYSQVNNIFDHVVANSLSIFGTTSADTFRLQNARYSTNNHNTVNYTNKTNLIVNGSVDDQVIVDGTVGIESTVTFNNVRIFSENEGKIQSRSLELVNTGDVGSVSSRLNTAVNELSLDATNGAVFLEEQDGLVIKNFNVSTTNMVDLKVGGNLSASGSLVYTGSLNLESLRGNIDLGNNNSLTGTLNLKAAGNLSLHNLQSISLNNLIAQNANIRSDSSIKSTGIFSVAGLAALGANSDISLLGEENDVNQVRVDNANNLDFYDKNGFTSVGLNVTNNVNLKSTGGIILGSSCTTDCNNVSGITTKNLNIESATIVTVAKNIFSSDSTAIKSQGVVVNDSIKSKQIAINAGNGKLVLNETGNLLGQDGNSIEITANNIEQSSSIVSAGNINITATADVIMTEKALIESLSGDIAMRGKDLQLALLKTPEGNVVMNAQGAIRDGNGNATNIIAKRWDADAVNGIGTGLGDLSGADAIETDIDILSVRNLGKLQNASGVNNTSSINIANTKASNTQQLRKTGGTSDSIVNTLTIESLINNGDIGISNIGDILLDNTGNIIYNPEEVNALRQGGVINTNTGINGGQLLLTITNGMVRAANKANKQNPEIIAEVATFNFKSPYDFGERNRKVVMHIPEVYNQNSRMSFVTWYLTKPKIMNDFSKVPPDSLISGRDQLIQIEGLSDIDPAIFTKLSNYVHDEVAILLPIDQRFDDEDDIF